MALSIVHSSIAERVVYEWPGVGDVETLTRWCIANNIVYPDPLFDDKGLQFLGWQFADKSLVIFDDNNMPRVVDND